MNKIIENRLISKAKQSSCRYRISAIAFDYKNEVIGYSSNKPLFDRKHGGLHAEECLMNQYKQNIKTILICRVNKNGVFRPIEPCSKCSNKANKLNIKIVSIEI